jgi:hypothetical protein
MDKLELTKEEIFNFLKEISLKLEKRGLQGEIILFGGAVMTLVLDARNSTKDVDAIFHPPQIIREIAKEIAFENQIAESWLNDGIKGFISAKGDYSLFYEDTNLKIFSSTPEYILAMKCISLRLGESRDEEDVIFLIKKLKLKNSCQVFEIIEKYYPNNCVPPKTQYALEEYFEYLKE